MGNLSNDRNMRIHRLHMQGFGAKAIRVSYPDKNWSLNRLNTICHRVDEMGSVATRIADSGRLSSRVMDTAIVSFRSRLRSCVAAAGGQFEHSV